MNGGSFVGEMGVDFFEEASQVNHFVVDRYPSSPVAVFIVPIHTFIGTAATCLLCSIGVVLSARAGSQVAPPVVQSDSVPVVNFLKVKSCSFCNYTVHGDYFLSRCFRDSRMARRVVVVSVPRTPSFLYEPFPLHKEVIVNRVNDGEFALCKWNETGSCIHVSYSEGRFCLTDESTFRSPFNQN